MQYSIKDVYFEQRISNLFTEYIRILTAALAFVVRLTETGQFCSSCIDIANPDDCASHTKCDNTEQCYHRKYTKGSSPPLYEFGCISSHACTNTPTIFTFLS